MAGVVAVTAGVAEVAGPEANAPDKASASAWTPTANRPPTTTRTRQVPPFLIQMQRSMRRVRNDWAEMANEVSVENAMTAANAVAASADPSAAVAPMMQPGPTPTVRPKHSGLKP
jgi:hypothetical protein